MKSRKKNNPQCENKSMPFKHKACMEKQFVDISNLLLPYIKPSMSTREKGKKGKLSYKAITR
jgi:hypothetical protein